jgi:glycosyltransferase involved in cell wall biosynthesis
MISVIIPVYNSEVFLSALFLSIQNQTLDTDLFEILFIDNNSTDKSPVLIKDFIVRNSKLTVKYFKYTQKASSYAARNYGVKKARGEILAFTDSDCILKDDWLVNIYNEFRQNADIIVSGKIELFLDNKENIWENFDKIVHMRNDLRIKKNQIATANMAVSKKTFLKIGFFPEVKSGGDFAWAEQAAGTNKKIIYKNNIIVFHPSRKSYQEIKKKLKRLAYGEGQLFRENNKKLLYGIFKNILRLIYLPKHIYISKNMISNVGFLRVIKFNFLYLFLKLKQIFYFIKGYGDKSEK